ncbi:Chromo-like domain superfamily [Arabidopsis thaliana x Arabidopsis arenosa]|uniref:Single-strand DNA endonuclease 1 n=1 Tax=Arabidopsis thaliana x Arabidopsis arenosa TaxID=1240361 RepID=A0A8T1ZPI9_9BRAS|nr:Chromo-like domain superfamily [Arabidopsis thaliana x Arabidopsis arenosa]
MGVKYLWDVLEPCKKTFPLDHLQNKRVCVDLSCWMVELHKVNKSYCATKEKVYLRGLFHRLRALIALNCSIILVSDGAIPGIKVPTYRRRLKARFEVADDGVQPSKETSLKRNMGSEFSCIIKEAKVIASTLGILCLDGIEEAEAQCALLNSESLCDACFSSDSDIFLFGAKTVYREICLGEGGYVVCYEMDDIKKKLGLGRNSLIALALLLGSDYSQGVRGLRQEKACELVKSIGENVILEKVASEGLAFAEKPRKSKKQVRPSVCSKKGTLPLVVINGNNREPEGLEQIKQVIDAFMDPKCHQADSATVSRALAEFSFQRTKLQEICHQFFEWPPEKTDEYILPKVAERNLRRFTILHKPKMPERCPVSEIIKTRKVQGRECFEVSWNDLEGLETSIVPAELVERACPEKIIEFKEKMAAKKKKPKPKQKQKETSSPTKSSSLAELSLELQHLDLNSTSLVTRSTVEVSEQANEQQNSKKHDYLCLIDSPDRENCNNAWSTRNKFGDGLSSFSLYPETEVIDLISPCPEARSRSVSRSHQEQKRQDHQLETVIELSDSETDDEEHCKKARELRIFLENIRKDIIL